MSDNVIPLRPRPEGLLGLPPCPVRHCTKCGRKEGWHWVSRDWGCSECATVDDLSMRLVAAAQTIEELRARLVFCSECSSAPGEACQNGNVIMAHAHDVRVSTSVPTPEKP